MNTGPTTTWHGLSVEEASRRLGVDPANGLASDEVHRRRAREGPNRLPAPRGRPAWRAFLEQFHQPLVYLLLAAATITGSIGEWVDSVVILGVVLLNAVLGYIQESRATQAIQALGRLLTVEASVRRNGQVARINSEELVPGDIVLLTAGERVPADLRLRLARELHVDESALTGESMPVLKDCRELPAGTPLADRRNIAHAGTLVTAGQATGMVCATGGSTETGRISRLIEGAEELSTPLTRKITQFSRLLLWVVIGLAAATVAVGLARGNGLVEMFMAAVALAVGTIPEGLPAAVTIVLAIGVARMARRRAIIRRLPAVETLGSTTVVCTDKTGTLTENQMTVRELHAGGRLFEVTGSGYDPAGEIRLNGVPFDVRTDPALFEVLRAGVLCNEAVLSEEGGRWQIQGDPTEAALLVAGRKAGLIHADTHSEAPRVDMIPFESAHMYRATLHERDGGRVIYQVGALERLLDRCSDALDARGQHVPLDRCAVELAAEQMAARGLRVLAFARRHVESHHASLEPHHIARGLTFLGLQGMMDPPRQEASGAVARCHRAGIEVKMITGDNPTTAGVVAIMTGIVSPGADPAVVTGRELEQLDDGGLAEVAARGRVFARVTPEQKLRLVRALQARGQVVAMTGDGVNDAPALRQADIGVAMGCSGTEVARAAAAMVLTDDNFATIEAAVEEGRGVFDNLVKFIVWILPTNLGEALILLVSILLGLPLPALPLQLLWVNLTDTLLGLPLAFEPTDPGAMQRPPRPPGRPLLTWPLLMRTGLVSLAMLAGGIGLFLWELHVAHASLAAARTAVVNLVVLVEAVYLFNCRSLTLPVFRLGLLSNPWAIAGTLAMVAGQVFFTHAPVMNRLFHTAPIEGGAWLRIAILCAGLFAVVELEKWIRFGGGRAEGVTPE